MYKIGEFSKIANLPVKTLRYYNEIGLLIPEEVDIYTGYRYYGEKNLKDVEMIKQLKSVGFTLDEIINNWKNFNEENFEQKKRELYQEQYNIEQKIRQLDYLRNHIINGEIVDYEIKTSRLKSLKER